MTAAQTAGRAIALFIRSFLVSASFLSGFSSIVRASEIAIYYLPNAQVEYEGTGFREVDQGWELKVKPRSAGAGVRWRHLFSDRWAMQTQYWNNRPFFDREDGNTKSGPLRQTGQTRLAVHNLMIDGRRRLEGSSVEVVVGAQGVYEDFQRKDIVFNLATEAGQSRETLRAAGAYMGFHAGNGDDDAALRPYEQCFFWDGEVVLGHLFHTDNSQQTGGGGIRSDGYTYAFRFEFGWKTRSWAVGLGYLRQLFQIHVPGGKTFPTGAVRSLPINKTDFFSPFLTVRYVY